MKLKVVCLSLPRCRDRRARFEAEARRVGLVFEYVDGLDARMLPAHQLLTLADEEKALVRFGRPLATSEIACSEGHRTIYRNLLKSGDDGVVVLEDDIGLNNHFVEVVAGLRALGNEAGERSEVYFLGGREGLEHGPLWVSRRKPLRILGESRLLSVVKSDRALLGTWSYLITRAAAAAVLRSEPNISGAADQWDLRLSEGVLHRAWVLEPPAAFHSRTPTDSLLDEERMAVESELAARDWPQPTGVERAIRKVTNPGGLLRSVAYRLGWRRLKTVAYALLSWVS